MRPSTLITGIAVLALCCSVPAWCDIANGGFESGLSGWTYGGAYVGAVTDEYARDFLGLSQAPWDDFWDPTEGTQFASLWSTDSMGTDYATLSQTFSANALDTLSFDYFFDFGDLADYPDTATATVQGPSSFFDVLFEINFYGELGDDENIDWTSMSLLLPETGDYTITFGVSDGPGSFESILGVDNVVLTAIPAPDAALLGVIGVATVGAVRRRLS